MLSRIFRIAVMEISDKTLLFAQNARGEETQVIVLSIVIILLLLAASLYLLFIIRKKHAAERQLNMVSSEREMLFNNAPCGYHSVDAEGKVLSMNDTLLRWLGYDREEVVGRMRFTEVVDADGDMIRSKID